MKVSEKGDFDASRTTLGQLYQIATELQQTLNTQIKLVSDFRISLLR